MSRYRYLVQIARRGEGVGRQGPSNHSVQEVHHWERLVERGRREKLAKRCELKFWFFYGINVSLEILGFIYSIAMPWCYCFPLWFSYCRVFNLHRLLFYTFSKVKIKKVSNNSLTLLAFSHYSFGRKSSLARSSWPKLTPYFVTANTTPQAFLSLFLFMLNWPRDFRCQMDVFLEVRTFALLNSSMWSPTIVFIFYLMSYTNVLIMSSLHLICI